MAGRVGSNVQVLVSLDLVVPERVEDGWVCRRCVKGVPYTGITPKLYQSREDVWRDQLFEEFMAWVNGKLTRADTLAFFGDGGMTSAYLLPVEGATCAEQRPGAASRSGVEAPRRGGRAALASDIEGRRPL